MKAAVVAIRSWTVLVWIDTIKDSSSVKSEQQPEKYVNRTSMFRRLFIVKLVNNLFSGSCTSFTPQLSTVVSTCIIIFLRSVYTFYNFRCDFRCDELSMFWWRYTFITHLILVLSSTSSEDENRTRNRRKNCKCRRTINHWQSNWRPFSLV
jgi:hypothetical protein